MKLRQIIGMATETYPDKHNRDRHSKKELPPNAYDLHGTIEQGHDTFSFIHYFFKYKVFVPMIWLADIVLRKYYVKKIKCEPHNRNMIIFNKSFDTALYKWNMIYRRNGQRPRKSIGYWEKVTRDKTNPSTFVPQTMKQIMLTMIQYDTAYKELFNILMHEITINMVKEYSDKKKYPNGVGHLFYSQADIYDVHYKFLFKVFETRVGMTLHEAMEEFEQEKLSEKGKH